MKKFLIILTVLVSLPFFAPPVFAANTLAIIDATITPMVISVEIPAGCATSVAYTDVPLGATSRDPDGVPVLCAKNNGSDMEDFEIRGADAESASGNIWTLSSTKGADQYVHKYGVGASPSTWHALTTSQVDNEWANDVPVGENRDFRLRIDTPTESSSYEEHTTTVTVIATAH